MNGKFITNTMIIRYFTRKKLKPQLPPRLLTLILKTPECIRLLNLECPWCGRKFSTVKALRRHVIMNKYTTVEERSCVFHFDQLVNYLTDTYYRMSFIIRQDNRKYYVRGYNWYFRTLDDAVEAALNVINNSELQRIH